MITYTWGISRLDCAPSENGLTDVVKVIRWVFAGQDENGISASISNSYPLPSPTPESFTDYSTLTQETVISWLESNLDVGYLQTTLANEIASKYNPPITPLPLPWIKVEEPIVVPEEPVIFYEGFNMEEGVFRRSLIFETPVEEVVEEPTEETLEEKIDAGYDPEAIDGDADGIVQDGTEWERPIGTEL
jgi:hypothetical protein